MTIDFSSIKNIIFDLGNVVIDIDFEITFQAFADILKIPYKEADQFLRSSQLNHRNETGQISEQELIEEVQAFASHEVSAQQIKDAWNALLLEMPNERIELIKALGKKYRTYVLSNTNQTHIDEVNAILKRNTGISDLKEIFTDTVYYSHEMGMSKPGIEIYNTVLKNSELNPNETLFIDDREDNVLGARKAGIQAVQLVKPITILDILKNA